MTTETTTPAVETAAPKAETKKTSAKKTATGNGGKGKATGATAAPVKKAAKKAAPPAPKSGLRGPQERILKCLNKSNKPLTRAQIAEKAPVDVASCVEYLGSHDPAKRAANDEKHFPSLITLGLVKLEQKEGEPVVYTITAKGKAQAAKL